MPSRKGRTSHLYPQSSQEFVRFLERCGVSFIRWGKGDHAIFGRTVAGANKTTPVIMGKKTLDPQYQKQVLYQLGFSKEEIRDLVEKYL